MRRVLGLAAGLCTAAGAALAHPHIFIDTGLHLHFDDEGRLAAVRVIWSYDEFTSLLVLEDRGLDPDYDGVLTEAERAVLDGFDMNWEAGWPGDTYLRVGDTEIPLSRPLEHTADLVEGRVVSTHLRALETRVAPGAETIQVEVYDPTYYTAYTLTLPTRLEGREGCAAEVVQPDLTAANQRLLDAMAELGADATLEDAGLPPIGAEFAERLRVTCSAPS